LGEVIIGHWKKGALSLLPEAAAPAGKPFVQARRLAARHRSIRDPEFNAPGCKWLMESVIVPRAFGSISPVIARQRAAQQSAARSSVAVEPTPKR
jgi:hypothetical protein